jgi:hypothetical protein
MIEKGKRCWEKTSELNSLLKPRRRVKKRER